MPHSSPSDASHLAWYPAANLMNQELNFRSALSGYNRDDVEAYVEKVNAAFATYESQLSNLDGYKKQLEAVMTSNDELQAMLLKAQQDKEKIDELRQQLADANSEIARLTVQNEVSADVASGMLGDSLDAEPSGKEHDLMEMQQTVSELRTALGRAKAAVEADTRAAQQKDERIYNLQQLVDQYKADAAAYQATCANLGLIEMEARSRMAQEKMRSDTENQTQREKTEQYCQDWIARTKAEAAQLEQESQQRIEACVAQMKTASSYVNQYLTDILDKVAATEDVLRSLEHSVDPVISAVNDCEQNFKQNSPYLPEGDGSVSDLVDGVQDAMPPSDTDESQEEEFGLDIFSEESLGQDDSSNENEPAAESENPTESPENAKPEQDDKDVSGSEEETPAAAEPAKKAKQQDKQGK